MLSSLKNIVRVADLRNKVLFTLLVIAIYQLGANIPVPGVNLHNIEKITNASKGSGILGFLNLFSGGALARAAVLGLGIMPYITSSIIIQLLTTVIPKFTEWRDQGAVGQRKLTQATRYLTVSLALMQSSGLVFLLHSGELTGTGVKLITTFTPPRVLFIILTFTAGTAFVMWLGELITQRGIGQGMSIIIFANVVATLPLDVDLIKADKSWGGLIIIGIVCVALLVAIVFMELGQRRIPVTFARRVQGRRMYGGQSTYIPLKVNQAGVIPIIFAMSILMFPMQIAQWINSPIAQNIARQLQFGTAWNSVVYALLIIFFTYFYTAIVFNPMDVADNLKKYGGFVPGLRPGRPTGEYINRVLTKLTLAGAIFLALIAVLPNFMIAATGISSLYFGGTALLIVVGVALETMKQFESHLLMRHYQGFMK